MAYRLYVDGGGMYYMQIIKINDKDTRYVAYEKGVFVVSGSLDCDALQKGIWANDRYYK